MTLDINTNPAAEAAGAGQAPVTRVVLYLNAGPGDFESDDDDERLRVLRTLMRDLHPLASVQVRLGPKYAMQVRCTRRTHSDHETSVITGARVLSMFRRLFGPDHWQRQQEAAAALD